MSILRDVNAKHFVLVKLIVVERLHLPLRLDVEDANVARRVADKDDCAIFRTEHANTGDESVVLMRGLFVKNP